MYLVKLENMVIETKQQPLLFWLVILPPTLLQHSIEHICLFQRSPNWFRPNHLPGGKFPPAKKLPSLIKWPFQLPFRMINNMKGKIWRQYVFYAGWSRSINLLLRKSNLAQSETLPLLSDICLLSMKVKEKLPRKMRLQKEYIHFQIQWKQ